MLFQNILDLPRIVSFQPDFSGTDAVTLTCLAEAIPKPTYTIFSDGVELKEVLNGVVIIRSYTSNSDATYKCIARNYLGQDFKNLSLHSLKG